MTEPTSVAEQCRRDCARCGHSSDWHSFKDGENPGRDLTDEDIVFSCNGPDYGGCGVGCPDMVDPAGWRPPWQRA